MAVFPPTFYKHISIWLAIWLFQSKNDVMFFRNLSNCNPCTCFIMNLELKELIFQASHKSSFSFSGTALEYLISVQHKNLRFIWLAKKDNLMLNNQNQNLRLIKYQFECSTYQWNDSACSGKYGY